MTCAEAARLYVLTLSPVTSLVNQRVFSLRFPQNPTLPAVCFQQIGDIHLGHLRGAARWKWARVQVDCLGATLAQARAVDQAVKGEWSGGVTTGLQGANGEVGSPSIRLSVSAEVLGYRELYEPDELKQARIVRDYQVWIED